MLITSLWRTVIPFFTYPPNLPQTLGNKRKIVCYENHVKEALLCCFGERETLVEKGVQMKEPDGTCLVTLIFL